MDQTGSPMPAYLASLARTAIATGAGYLAGKGYITGEQSAELVAGGLVLLAALWSLLQKWRAHRKLQAAIDASAGKAS